MEQKRRPLDLRTGDRVRNFGQTATVVGFHKVTGDPILQDDKGLKWVANVGKCEPVEE